MGFDAQAFTGASLKPRTEEVEVQPLAQWFGEGEKPVWVVRGLTGAELGRAHEAENRAKAVGAAVEAVASGNVQADSIKELLGLSGDVPADVARRLSMLAQGSVEPAVDHELAVKLSEAHPTIFYHLTNRILSLTGAGAEPGKRKGSTPKPKSEEP